MRVDRQGDDQSKRLIEGRDDINKASLPVSVSFVCEPGRLEAQALLLAASLRAEHPEIPLLVAVPQPLPDATAAAFAALDVAQHAIVNPLDADYRIGHKIAALGVEPCDGLRVFLDSDMLCLKPLPWRELAVRPVCAKPADLATFGSPALWQTLYPRFGLEPPTTRVLATVSQQLMYPYYNAGMVATTQAPELARVWAQTCLAIDAMDDINPRRPWLDQIGLPLAAARQGLAVRSLGERWNYPAHIMPLRDGPMLVHYHLPEVVAREPLLLARVAELTRRWPLLLPVLQADAGWAPVLHALRRDKSASRAKTTSAAKPGKPCAAAADLIITGIPRSGTSFVCRSLDSFSNVAVVNEPAALFEGLPMAPDPWAVPLLHADLRRRIDAGEAVANKLDARGQLTEDTAVEESVAAYRPQLADEHWVLATKNTLAYMARLEGLLRVMPQARVVACIRHPLDTLASWKGTFAHLAQGDPAHVPVGGLADPFLPLHLRQGLESLAGLATPSARRAAWWALLARELLRYRERIHIIRYEDLVSDPQAQMQQLLGPLANQAGAPRCPLAPSSLRTARREQLEDEDWQAADMFCADIAESFGYDWPAAPPRRSASQSEARAPDENAKNRVAAPPAKQATTPKDEPPLLTGRQEVPASPGVPASEAGDRDTRPVDIQRVDGADTLFIFFGGVAGAIGMPPFEFYNASKVLHQHRIFVRDVAQSWYHSGLPGISTDIHGTARYLREQIEAISPQRVVFVGNSMGGFAALLFSSLLGQGEVIAFAPQTFISPALRLRHGDNRWPEQMARTHRHTDPDPIWDLLPLLEQSSGRRVQVFVSASDPLDLVHAERLEALDGVALVRMDNGGHDLVRVLRDQGRLAAIMRGDATAPLNDKMAAPDNPRSHGSTDTRHAVTASTRNNPSPSPDDYKDEWIRTHAAGKSFMDIGGLWDTRNEKISLAIDAGATRATKADVTPLDHPLWRDYDAHLRQIGLQAPAHTRLDMAELPDNRAGLKHQLVHCSGMIYHVPDPCRMIANLRELATERLILTSMVVPERIENEKGQLDFPADRAVFVPSMTAETREIVAAHFDQLGLKVGAVNMPLDEPWRWPDGTPNYGPWWWLMSPAYLRGMLEVAGFTVEDECWSWAGRSYSFLARNTG